MAWGWVSADYGYWGGRGALGGEGCSVNVWEGIGEGRDLPSGLTVLAGTFLVGVVFVVGLMGVFFSVVMGLGGMVESVSFLTAVALVVVGVVLEALLTGVFAVVTGVFLTGVEVVAGLSEDLTGSVFWVPRGVLGLAGVAFAGAGAFG